MVLALYELGGHEPKCAAAWLWRRLGYARGWPDAGKMASLERVVENEFLQSDITLGGAVAALGPEGSRARSLANSFHHGWQLALWSPRRTLYPAQRLPQLRCRQERSSCSSVLAASLSPRRVLDSLTAHAPGPCAGGAATARACRSWQRGSPCSSKRCARRPSPRLCRVHFATLRLCAASDSRAARARLFSNPLRRFVVPFLRPCGGHKMGTALRFFLQEKLRPPGGHEMIPLFAVFFLVFVRSRSRRRTEALASWSWWKYLSSEAERRGQQVLRISLDGDLHEPRACRHEGDTIAMLAGLEP